MIQSARDAVGMEGGDHDASRHRGTFPRWSASLSKPQSAARSAVPKSRRSQFNWRRFSGWRMHLTWRTTATSGGCRSRMRIREESGGQMVFCESPRRWVRMKRWSSVPKDSWRGVRQRRPVAAERYLLETVLRRPVVVKAMKSVGQLREMPLRRRRRLDSMFPTECGEAYAVTFSHLSIPLD